jgi:hypothetical protein
MGNPRQPMSADCGSGGRRFEPTRPSSHIPHMCLYIFDDPNVVEDTAKDAPLMRGDKEGAYTR